MEGVSINSMLDHIHSCTPPCCVLQNYSHNVTMAKSQLKYSACRICKPGSVSLCIKIMTMPASSSMQPWFRTGFFPMGHTIDKASLLHVSRQNASRQTLLIYFMHMGQAFMMDASCVQSAEKRQLLFQTRKWALSGTSRTLQTECRGQMEINAISKIKIYSKDKTVQHFYKVLFLKKIY